MRKQFVKTAFSLLELSVVLVIVAILMAGIFSGKRMIDQGRLRAAQGLTRSSTVTATPDLALWLETSLDGSVTTSSGNMSNNEAVSDWNDVSSGSKASISQGNTANRPTYITKGINDLPAIKFNGTSSVLYTTTNAPINSGSNQYTIVMVVKINALTKSIFIEQKTLANTSNTAAAIWLDNPNIKMSAYNNDTDNNDTETLMTPSAGNTYIFVMTVDNTLTSNNVSLYANSNTPAYGTNDNISSLNVANEVFSIGARVTTGPAFSDFSNTSMSEVIVYNRLLNRTEIHMINNYLSKKYNITVS